MVLDDNHNTIINALPELLLRYAVQEISRIEIQDVFLVKDLFRDIDWRHIPLENRMQLGILFRNYIEKDENATGIRKIKGMAGKTPDGNQRKYIKIMEG